MKYLLSVITLLFLNLGFSQYDLHEEFQETKELLSENLFEDNENLSELIIDRIDNIDSHNADVSDVAFVSDGIFKILTDDMKSFEKDYTKLRMINDEIQNDINVVENYKSMNLQLWGKVTDLRKEKASRFKMRVTIFSIMFLTGGILIFFYIRKKLREKREKWEKENNYETKTKWGTTTKLSDGGQKELNDYMNRYKK